MNKQSFLKQLERELKHIPAEDREDAITYYREYFEEMGIEDTTEVPAELGSPKELARAIIDECVDKHVERQGKKGCMKNGASLVWLIILGICAAPIALLMVIVGVAFIFLIAVMLFFIGVAIFLAGVGGLLMGIFLIPAVFVAGSLGQSIVCLGLALLGGGLGILLYFGARALSVKSIAGELESGDASLSLTGAEDDYSVDLIAECDDIKLNGETIMGKLQRDSKDSDYRIEIKNEYGDLKLDFAK